MSLKKSKTTFGGILPVHFDGKEPRFCGCIKTNKMKMAVKPYTAFHPVIDLKEIGPFDYSQPNIPILDQKQNGSCTAHGWTTALMKARERAGMSYVALSPDSLYAQINDGVDEGSDPADAVGALAKNGICQLSEVPDNFILWEQIPNQAKENAKRFRIETKEVYRCTGESGSIFNEMVTAAYLRFSIVLTVCVGPNFNPDPNGVVGYSRGQGNHCTAGDNKFEFDSKGNPLYWAINSWTNQWSIGGKYKITRKHIDSQPNVEVFALRLPLSDPQDPANPPRS
jgi:hypothetical protein